MMNCPACGGENTNGAERCAYCGSNLSNAGTGNTESKTGRRLLELITLNERSEAARFLVAARGAEEDTAILAVDVLSALRRTHPYSEEDIAMAVRMSRRPGRRSMPFSAGAPATPARPLSPQLGCLGLLAVIGACIVAMCLISMASWTTSGAYRQAMARVRADANVNEFFGAPINTQFGFWTGSAGGGSGWTMRFDAPIAGPRRSGNMLVRASTNGSYFDENWTVQVTITYDADGKRQAFVVR
ncbi:MAG: cytochrome c oxidase assembly factor Coa1 family protein [Thermoflexales bacterium]